MIERQLAVALAGEWCDAWNAHDPDAVVAHYADDVIVHSPLAAQLRPESHGVLRGKDAVLSYYRDGLAGLPGLHFTLIEVCSGLDEITIVYRNHRDVVVAETLILDDDGLANEVRVAYGA
jgi:hypothetical protein